MLWWNLYKQCLWRSPASRTYIVTTSVSRFYSQQVYGVIAGRFTLSRTWVRHTYPNLSYNANCWIVLFRIRSSMQWTAYVSMVASNLLANKCLCSINHDRSPLPYTQMPWRYAPPHFGYTALSNPAHFTSRVIDMSSFKSYFSWRGRLPGNCG